MKKFLLLFIVSCTVTVGYAQNDYYFGYQEGFKYGCSCQDMPSKNVALVRGTWEQGYLDGKIDGVKYYQTKPQTTTQQRTYKRTEHPDPYESNTQLLIQTLSQKQNLLDSRRLDLQNRAKTIENLLIQLTSKKTLTQSQKNYIMAYADEMVRVSNWDFTNNQNYNNVVNYMNRVQQEIISWF